MELEDTLCYKCKKFNLNGGDCDPRDYIDIVGLVDECEEFKKLGDEEDEFEDDLWKLIEDYPHPVLTIGDYKICVYDDGDEDDGFIIYKNGLFLKHLEIPQKIIDYFDEIDFDWRSVNYIIEEEGNK